MIKKISEIKNLAVFKDFNWDTCVRDKGNNVVHFAQLNVIYGRNYSGKTSLSRIVRALETGKLSRKYNNAEFKVEFQNGQAAVQLAPTAHSYQVRVFNEDFVRENLSVFFDDDSSITPFAVIGKENADDAKKLEKLEKELGTVDSPGPLLTGESKSQQELRDATLAVTDKQDALESQLRDKANKKNTGIKYNEQYNFPTYNIQKINADIKTVRSNDYNPLDQPQVKKHADVLGEKPKARIQDPTPLALKYDDLVREADELLQREVTLSEQIKELLGNVALQEWVRQGRELHFGTRTTCGFCGNRLDEDLKAKIDKHFNKESEELRDTIKDLMSSVKTEVQAASLFISVDTAGLYSTFRDQAQAIVEERKRLISTYQRSLNLIHDVLQKRRGDIFNPISLPSLEDVTDDLNKLHSRLKSLITNSNSFTTSLVQEQTDARKALRLHEVAGFIATIKYQDQRDEITKLKTTAESKRKEYHKVKALVEDARRENDSIKERMSNEQLGAEKVNDYLNHYFGHPTLSLKPERNAEGEESIYRFEIIRNGIRADNLSEGERGLIAFCYFIARLDDEHTIGISPIVWIDDPVSSLDDSHAFFIYSLINKQISSRNPDSQLFISTHSLTFLKYLKRLPGNKNVKKHFVVHRTGTTSEVLVMPRHLEAFATEFHYLFDQIYKCSIADEAEDTNADIFYNFGNNVRKFLEMYLYFKYPNAVEGDKTKLARFFGEDRIATSLTERVDNEYSHLQGVFERGMVPMDVPAMKSIAEFILRRIELADPPQYESLLISIGVTPPANALDEADQAEAPAKIEQAE